MAATCRAPKDRMRKPDEDADFQSLISECSTRIVRYASSLALTALASWSWRVPTGSTGDAGHGR